MKINTDDLFPTILSYIGKFFKLAWKVIVFIAGIATILSVVFSIFGTGKVKEVINAIADDFMALKTLFQVSFTVALVLVGYAAIYCVIYINKTYLSLSSKNDKNEKHLKNIENLLERERNLGILAINPRTSSKYSNDAYQTLFSRANKEFIISGHSLNKTINKKTSVNLRNEFITTIIRFLKNECDVKILLVKPNTSTDRQAKRKEFDEFINELYDKLKIENIQNEIIINKYLEIKETDFLPYYIVKTEHILYIAHYSFGECMDSSAGNMYIFETEASFGYGQYCYNDFISCFDKAEYIEEYRKLFEGEKNE